MKDNALMEKSIDFATRIVKLSKYLEESKKDFVISKQILRSGTSIGANINEAQYAVSKADFVSKLHISLKETAETEYWLRLLYSVEYIENKMFESILADCLDLKKILISSINTAKKGNDL